MKSKFLRATRRLRVHNVLTVAAWRRSRITVFACAGVVILFGVAESAQRPRTTPTALPSLAEDGQSEARAINNRGVVAGVSFAEDAITTAVVWGTDLGISPLLPLPADFTHPLNPEPGEAPFSVANAINAVGQVAGAYNSLYKYINPDTMGTEECGFGTAVIWDLRDGSVTTLPPLPGDQGARVHGINNNGEAVGTSFDFPGNLEGEPFCFVTFSAVKWDRDGNPIPLLSELGPTGQHPTTGITTESYGSAISESGVAVGGDGDGDNAFGAFLSRAVAWDNEDATPTLLPVADVPNLAESWGTSSINNDGVVTGSHLFIAPGFSALSELGTRWDAEGVLTYLSPLDGHDVSSGLSINNRDDIAGYSAAGTPIFGPQATTAVVWNSNGEATPLDPLCDGCQSQALGINDPGEAVGFSLDGEVSTAVIWR